MDHLLPLFVWLDGLADVDPITRAIWIDAGVIIAAVCLLVLVKERRAKQQAAEAQRQAEADRLAARVRAELSARVHRSAKAVESLRESHVVRFPSDRRAS